MVPDATPQTMIGGDDVGMGAAAAVESPSPRQATLQSLTSSLEHMVQPAAENEAVFELAQITYFHPQRRTALQAVADNCQPSAEQQTLVAAAQDALYRA
eukprot:COSAG01_NODE_3058_length_6654_cov_3.122636_4_plen_99_part_00